MEYIDIYGYQKYAVGKIHVKRSDAESADEEEIMRTVKTGIAEALRL